MGMEMVERRLRTAKSTGTYISLDNPMIRDILWQKTYLDEETGEYIHMLVSYIREDGPEAFQDGNFIELPLLQRGVLWGIGRLVRCKRLTLATLPWA